MPSNEMYACVDCRVGGKAPYPVCVSAGHKVIRFGKHITIPKRNNKRAWKRIAKGNIYWDDKKVARDPSRKEWHERYVIIEDDGSWTIVSYMSDEYKKRLAKRLIGPWLKRR